MNPWITPGIIASVKKKHFYYKEWKKYGKKHNASDNNTIYIRYKNYRRYLKKTIKLAKKNFYCKKFESFKGNLKKTWAIINELRGKVKSNIKASFVINGRLVEDRREISNEFNIFFSKNERKTMLFNSKSS